MTIFVVLVLVAAGALDLIRTWLAKRRARKIAKIFNESQETYLRVLAGLRTMAGVVTGLPGAPQALSRQGVNMLDTQANASVSFRHVVRNLWCMSRDRALRRLTREFLRLQDHEAVFRQFQREVLRAVWEQAGSGNVEPPEPVRGYRVVFRVLSHRLPRELWPVMNEVLADGVQLTMKDGAAQWHVVPVTFAMGGLALFKRTYLERAALLQMVIRCPDHPPKVFEYVVEHEVAARPGPRGEFSG